METPMSTNVSHRKMIQALATHYRPMEWVFVAEWSPHTGFAQRWIDGYALNCWRSKGFKRIAFEVKVSRADFLQELRQPAKRQLALDWSHEYYFVTPPGLCTVTEIPSKLGLITLDPADGFRYNKVKRATVREAKPIGVEQAVSLARNLLRHYEQLS